MSEFHVILHQIERNGWLTTPIQGGWRLNRPHSDETIFMSITSTWLCFSMPFEEVATGIPHETIVRYIQNLSIAGWGIKESPRDLTWHLGYKGLLRVYDVYLNVTKMWAYFQVPILVDRVAPVLSAGNLEAQSLFLEYLLKLNATWFMAKIGISEADQVLLLVEVPVETLDFSLMQFLARTIGTYLDRYGQEIQIMALLHNDPRLSELLQAAAS